jgi:hypothetical protein
MDSFSLPFLHCQVREQVNEPAALCRCSGVARRSALAIGSATMAAAEKGVASAPEPAHTCVALVNPLPAGVIVVADRGR